MNKLFLAENEERSELFEVLASYIQPTLSKKAQVILLNEKQKAVMQLDTLPVLMTEEVMVIDPEKIIKEICKMAMVDQLIFRESTIWTLAKRVLDKELVGDALLDELNKILANKTYLIAAHITVADVIAIVPALRALVAYPVDKQISWVHLYRWGEFMLNLPYMSSILASKGLSLVPLASLKVEPKEEVKADTKKDTKKEQKKSKEQKQPKDQKKPKEQKKKEQPPAFSQLDIRVGKIIKVSKHPDSVKLYLEEIDIGKGEIRKVASGLQEHATLEEMQDRMVVVLCNLKEKKMGGYPSHGMVLCASKGDSDAIEILLPPSGSEVGEVVEVEGFERKPCGDINLSKKSNPWDQVQPKLTTSDNLEVIFEGKQLKTKKGVIKTKSLQGAHIS